MRIAPSLQRAVATMLFVVYAVCVTLGGTLVRCREADGSMSIEWRGAACCDPPPAPAADTAPAVTLVAEDEPADCAGCEDEILTKSLASDAVRRASGTDVQAKKLPVAAAPALVADRPAFEIRVERRPQRVPAPTLPPPLLRLRSVVLRC